MTRFLDLPSMSRLVRQVGLPRLLRELAVAITEDYLRWNDFDKSARLACHSPGGVIELMPVADAQRFAFKYVNGHPNNTLHGMPTVMAFGVLADVATGFPLFLSELTLTTALRTAATSALVAARLARPGSHRMALIGNGAQSEFQAIGFQRVLDIRELRVFDTDGRATAKLEQNLRALPEFREVRIVRTTSSAEACKGADIVTTVTADKCNAVILTPPMIAAGMHLNAVGGDCPGKTELHVDVLNMANVKVFVEYEPQSRIEGEIQQMPASFPVTEFADLARGTARGRTDPAQVTVFDSVGFALEDYSALRFLHALLKEERTASRQIDLVPELDNPKDLFGGTLGTSARSRLRSTASA